MHQSIAFRTAYLLTGSAARRRGGGADRLRQGLELAASLPPGCAVQALAAADRRERGAQPASRGGAAGGARAARRGASSGDATPSPEGAAIAGERRDELLAALERLDERDRDVLTCRYFLELSEEETAAVLDVRRGTVKSRTARALARLRAEVEVEP